jgi:hypothetical protein
MFETGRLLYSVVVLVHKHARKVINEQVTSFHSHGRGQCCKQT